jgi:predicted neuraminidase
LVLSFLGAVANVASVIGFYWSSVSASYVASLAVPVGASALAVLLLASAGLWIYVQIRRIAQLPGQREG